jgi:hypothetical protein
VRPPCPHAARMPSECQTTRAGNGFTCGRDESRPDAAASANRERQRDVRRGRGRASSAAMCRATRAAPTTRRDRGHPRPDGGIGRASIRAVGAGPARGCGWRALRPALAQQLVDAQQGFGHCQHFAGEVQRRLQEVVVAGDEPAGLRRTRGSDDMGVPGIGGESDQWQRRVRHDAGLPHVRCHQLGGRAPGVSDGALQLLAYENVSEFRKQRAGRPDLEARVPQQPTERARGAIEERSRYHYIRSRTILIRPGLASRPAPGAPAPRSPPR